MAADVLVNDTWWLLIGGSTADWADAWQLSQPVKDPWRLRIGGSTVESVLTQRLHVSTGWAGGGAWACMRRL